MLALNFTRDFMILALVVEILFIYMSIKLLIAITVINVYPVIFTKIFIPKIYLSLIGLVIESSLA